MHPTPAEKKVRFKLLFGHFKHQSSDSVLKSLVILGDLKDRQVNLETLELPGGN